MKVLFDHSWPFLLAHGGYQVLIEKKRDALLALGVEVEYLRWWDATQRGEIIHFFGRPTAEYCAFARDKGIRIVTNELLTGLGSRPAHIRALQRAMIRFSKAFLPAAFTARMAWGAYQSSDAIVATTDWEARLMREIFQAPPEKLHVIPDGVEDLFFSSPKVERQDWLLCSATITERKRVVETAEAAVAAGVPVHFLGKPYSERDPYFQKFQGLVQAHPQLLTWQKHIQDRALLAAQYRQARGFVLLSTQETLSLAAMEAAACKCPILLSNLPWAHSGFGDTVAYAPLANLQETARALKQFHSEVSRWSHPKCPLTWRQIAEKMKSLYAQWV